MNSSLLCDWRWSPPADWIAIATIEMHTGGEPLRVVTSGLPPIAGRTVLEKRRYFRDHLDHLRTGLMWEPRGHADMYGAIVTASLDADFDVFFLHNEGYSIMCGHAIIALTTLAVETGAVRVNDGCARLAFKARASQDTVANRYGGHVPAVETDLPRVPRLPPD